MPKEIQAIWARTPREGIDELIKKFGINEVNKALMGWLTDNGYLKVDQGQGDYEGEYR